MKLPVLIPIVALAVLIISLVCVWFSPSLQDFMAANQMWNGISQFHREFKTAEVDSLQPSQMPGKGTLVAIAYLEYSQQDLMELQQFVQDGGTLLLMDDFGYGNTVLSYLGLEARFSHQPLLDPLFCYKNPALPIISDFTPKIPGVNRVLMNHASTLVGVPDEAVLARSSTSSFMDVNGNSSYDEGEPRGPFAVAARFMIGRGTIVLVSDPSVAINSMVGRFDNYAFISGLPGGIGGGPIAVDRSHLPKVPLDVSKTRLTDARRWLANSYVVIVLTAVVLALAGTAISKGGTLEHESH
jgi:hypothetical protein